jgi:hypothetical protein
MSKVVTGPETRFSYANVWEAKAIQPGQDPKFSVSLIISKDDTATLKAVNAAIATAKAEGKEKHGAAFLQGKLRECLRDGDEERPDDAAYKNAYFINANSKTAPSIVDESVSPILDRKDFYSGCYGRASISIYPYNNVSKGIGCGLGNLQKLKDGDQLGGGSTASEDFGVEFEDDLA